MNEYLVFLVIWLICGYLDYGYYYAYVQSQRGRKGPFSGPVTFMFCLALGPLALITTLTTPHHNEHGRQYPWTSTRWRR